MYFSTPAALLALSTFLLPFASALPAHEYQAPYPNGHCTYQKKRAAVQAELDTIASHSFEDANRIPLAPDATRTFFVTPNELPEVTLKVNVGMNAEEVRAELVLLATALDAGVPKKSVHFINNGNGTVTSDFVQTDRIVLPHVHVREVHYFNRFCDITDIVGYVHGDIICPVSPSGIVNDVLRFICTELEALGLIGALQPVLGG